MSSREAGPGDDTVLLPDEPARTWEGTRSGPRRGHEPARPLPGIPVGPVTPEVPGRYEPIGELGEGGIGRVLLVRDRHIGREVAIKVLRSQGADVVRFLREARVTGQLEHPGIVPVYEVGQRPDGTLYYTMRRIEGRTLKEALDEAGDDLEARLRLLPHFADMCHAVAYAHSRGAIHRDLKPTNVMVGSFGETVVLDWGLVKIHGEPEPDVPPLSDPWSPTSTQRGATLGTPVYMSPEQALGEVDAIDARSDTWSLGVVLYQLLTGEVPFRGETVDTTLAAIVGDRLVQVRQREPDVPRELAAIAEKALQREPAARYADAGALANDVRAWLGGGWVRAHEYAGWELLLRFVRRNRVAVGAAVAVLAFLGVSLGAVSWGWRTAEDARQVAVEQEIAAHRNLAAGYLTQSERLLVEGDPLGAAVFGAASLLHDPRNPASPWSTGGDLPVEARLAAEAALYAGTTSPVRHLGAAEVRPARLSADGRWSVAPVGDRQVLAGPGGDVATRGSAQVLAVGEGAALLEGPVLWTAAGEVALPSDHVTAADFSADGALLATVHLRHLRLWSVPEGTLVSERELPADGQRVALAPDGSRVAVAVGDDRLQVWSAPELALSQEVPWSGSWVRILGWWGERVVVGDLGGGVSTWPPGGAPSSLGVHTSPIVDLAAHADLLVTADEAGGVRVWHAGRHAATLTAPGPRPQVSVRDGTLRVRAGDREEWWDLVGGTSILPGAAWDVALDGGAVLTAGEDGAVRRWVDGTPEVVREREASAWLVDCREGTCAAAWADGHVEVLGGCTPEPGAPPTALVVGADTLWVGGQDGRVRQWSLSGCALEASWTAHAGPILSLAPSPRGDEILTAGLDGQVIRWRGDTAISRWSIPRGEAWRLAWGPDDVLLTGPDGVVERRTPDGVRLGAHRGHRSWVNSVARGDDVWVTGGTDQDVWVWGRTGEPLQRIHLDEAVGELAVDATRIVVAGDDAVVVLPRLEGLVHRDPRELLAEAEARAGRKLVDFSLVPRADPVRAE